uniref:Uncharacterized protein n=1 Tax=Solanum lycopersicum TaxID=4081 RepID=K4DGJ5_SOLLC
MSCSSKPANFVPNLGKDFCYSILLLKQMVTNGTPLAIESVVISGESSVPEEEVTVNYAIGALMQFEGEFVQFPCPVLQHVYILHYNYLSGVTIHSILDLGVKPHLISKALLLSNFLYKHRGLENVHHCSTPAAKDCIIRSSCVPYDKVHQKSMLCFILPQTLYLFVLSSIFLLGYSDVVKYHRCRDSSSRTLGSRFSNGRRVMITLSLSSGDDFDHWRIGEGNGIVSH